jgi:hypothetical protein
MRRVALALALSLAVVPAPALLGQSVDDFPPLTADAAAAALQKGIGCPVDLLVVSVVAEEPDEEPGSRKVVFRLPVAAPDDLEVVFNWAWRVETNAEANGEPANEPSGEWRIASRAGPRRERAPGEAGRFRKAMGEIRTIATAVEAYAVDYGVYPPSGGNLWSRVVPVYLRQYPAKDPWGRPYRYDTGPGREHYVLSSAGEREVSRFPASYLRHLAEAGPDTADVERGSVDPDELVYSDGAFLSYPLTVAEPSDGVLLPGVRLCPPGPRTEDERR